MPNEEFYDHVKITIQHDRMRALALLVHQCNDRDIPQEPSKKWYVAEFMFGGSSRLIIGVDSQNALARSALPESTVL